MYLWDGKGGYIPWGLQTLTSSIFTFVSVQASYNSQLAVIQTNPVYCLLHLAWDWRGWHDDLVNGCLGGRRGLIVRNTWLLVVCDIDSASQGIHEPHGGTIRRWLVGDSLLLHIRLGMICRPCSGKLGLIEWTWVEVQAVYTSMIRP